MENPDMQNEPPVKKRRGRPPANKPGFSYGKETRAPRSAGRKPKHIDEALAVSDKPLVERSPEEQRAYRALKQREYLQRRREADAAAPEGKQLEIKPAKVSPRNVRALSTRPPRVYAPDNETAREVAGPDAVAVLDVKFVLPIELSKRLKYAAYALRKLGLDVDASRIVEMCLEGPLADIEATWNDGQPFPEPDSVRTPKRPIPRAKKKEEKG